MSKPQGETSPDEIEAALKAMAGAFVVSWAKDRVGKPLTTEDCQSLQQEIMKLGISVAVGTALSYCGVTTKAAAAAMGQVIQ